MDILHYGIRNAYRAFLLESLELLKKEDPKNRKTVHAATNLAVLCGYSKTQISKYLVVNPSSVCRWMNHFNKMPLQPSRRREMTEILICLIEKKIMGLEK